MSCHSQPPIINPDVPFTASIDGGLQDWKTITITGRIKYDAKRFHVNLQCGDRAGADVALHINVRFDNRPSYMVLNTCKNSAWGAEVRKYEAPFHRGSTFNLVIMVNPEKYKLLANGIHFMEYNHRMAFGQVDTVTVDGAVRLSSVSFQNPMAPCTPPRDGLPAMPRYSPSYVIPYKSILRGGLRVGRNITVQGMVHPDAKRFHVNLCYNSGIALHFSPRFDENTVVRNNQVQGRWGTEERSGGMPFSRGQMFTMIIVCESNLYRIIVNGVQAFIFNHRHQNLRQISILDVDGNLTLTSVTS
ncbi:galectin-9-like [Brienomyrus brachyistius]|uniref:galectin-9-like n=1 Tax=Brienomyrus brachyistius TaxID=42636 RepID=UPI0020B1B9F3|nr:galectin-9-like [Brienomyrus brachyistius]